jgi:hypothetical protein
MNNIGVICALTTFLNVWFGHVAVRYVEPRAVSIRLPAAVFAAAGLFLIRTALLTASPAGAAVLGITGMVILWDAMEFFRQERRVKQGHAPANPQNERHRRILAEYPLASSVDWLKREPLGRKLTADELQALRESDQ